MTRPQHALIQRLSRVGSLWSWTILLGLFGLLAAMTASRAWSDDDNPLAALLNSSVDADSQFGEITRETLLEAGELEIGILIDVQGDVERLYNFQPYGQASLGETVFTNEIISTYGDSLALIEFADGTTISLGANSEVMLDRFIFDPETAEGSLAVNMLSGVTKFVTGDMSADSYEIETPIGMAAIRGTELVFLIEPDGEMQLAVFSGAVDFSVFTPPSDLEQATADTSTSTEPVSETADPAVEESTTDTDSESQPQVSFSLTGRTLDSEETAALSEDFLSFSVSDTDGLQGAQGQMLESFTKVDIVFQDATSYSSFVGAFKTEQYEKKILDSCLAGEDCDKQLTGLVEELGELGVKKEDALGSLNKIQKGLSQSGAEIKSVRTALDKVKAISAAVEQTYTPQVKGSNVSGQTSAEEDSTDQASLEVADPEAVLLNAGKTPSGDGTGTEGSATLTGATTTDGSEETSALNELGGAQQTLGTVLTPGRSFTVFSKPSTLQNFEQTSTNQAQQAGRGTSNTNFGITFRVVHPYYASVYSLNSEAFIGAGTGSWIGLPANSRVMTADVGLRANGGFRMQVSFPALATSSGGCGPVVVSSINGTSNFYQVPGALTVSMGDTVAFELKEDGTIEEARSPEVEFELVEFVCEARPDGLYTGSIALELSEHKTHDLTVMLDIFTAQNGPQCAGPAEEQSFLCTNPGLSLQLQPIALELSQAAEQ